MKLRIGMVSLVSLVLAAGLARAEEQAVPEGEAVEAAGEAVPGLPPEVAEILGDTTPLTEIDAGVLRDRARLARTLAKQQGLADDVREQLQTFAKNAREELQRREAAAAEPAPAEGSTEQAAPELPPEVTPVPVPLEQQQTEEPAPPAEEAAPAEVQEPVQAETAPPVEEAPKTIEELAGEASGEPEQPAAEAPAEAAPEQPPAAETAEQPAAEPPPAETAQEATTEQPPAIPPEQLDSITGNPEAEAAAAKFLGATDDLDKLGDDELRDRLDAMRDLMAGNQLSTETERALRKKLQEDREVLRKRVALRKEKEDLEKQQKQAEEAAAAGKTAEQSAAAPPETAPVITIETPVPKVLADRRRSRDLSTSELRRRIEVIVEFERDDAYRDADEDDRRFWRETVRRDRELLRRRLAEERALRAEELESGEDDGLVVEVNPRRESIRSVFEAEANDAELEEVLISAPRQKPRRKVTIENIAEDESLRDAMPRIDIDTIRFGFDEAFVREEEIDNLDRVAGIIERILRRNPREIFLIEGHTDAVGSGSYNLKLSRLRAEAVKEALTEYFVIPARNLKTVGLGERYLRIPTLDAEAENRRVSVSRATPLVGELAD